MVIFSFVNALIKQYFSMNATIRVSFVNDFYGSVYKSSIPFGFAYNEKEGKTILMRKSKNLQTI